MKIQITQEGLDAAARRIVKKMKRRDELTVAEIIARGIPCSRTGRPLRGKKLRDYYAGIGKYKRM